MRLLSSNRLVTLTGPGGAGKTRLALAAAAELVEVFDDGPWVVELASLSHASQVSQSLASILGVREQPGRPLPAMLGEILQNRRVLLVLTMRGQAQPGLRSRSGADRRVVAGSLAARTSVGSTPNPRSTSDA